MGAQKGDSIGIFYREGEPIDFTVSVMGDGIGSKVGNQYNLRVKAVQPGGKAAAAGLRIGDELDYVAKGIVNSVEDATLIVDQKVLRLRFDRSNLDAKVKELLQTGIYQGSYTGGGGLAVFNCKGAPMPGEIAPDFTLPLLNTGGLTDLKGLLGNRSHLILFFKPGFKFAGGDREQFKMVKKFQPTFAELDANVAVMSTDFYGKFQSSQSYPVVSDTQIVASNLYGSLLDLSNVGPVMDRQTFVIGKDGRIEATYSGIGWEPTKVQLADHMADIVEFLGGDRTKALDTSGTKVQTVGEWLALSQKGMRMNLGQEAPPEKEGEEAVEPQKKQSEQPVQ